MAEYINNDGLRIRFDVDRINQLAPRGEAPGAGEDRVIDVIVDLADKAAGRVEGVNIPRNSFIAELYHTTVEETDATEVNLGTIEYDNTTAVKDAILKAADPSDLGVRHKVVAGDDTAGDLVGKITEKPYHLSYEATGATKGKIALRVHIFVAGKDKNPGNF